MDKHNLGWTVGKRYRIWTGTVDLVVGYDNEGWVIVQDEQGYVRKHLTTCHYEPLNG